MPAAEGVQIAASEETPVAETEAAGATEGTEGTAVPAAEATEADAAGETAEPATDAAETAPAEKQSFVKRVTASIKKLLKGVSK